MDGQTKLHRFRYHFGRGYVVPGDRVLDLGCGQGYGTEMIAEVAGKVIGIDIDEIQILANQNRGGRENIEYIHGDLENIELPKADVSVQFENLEHLYDPPTFAKKLKSKIKKFIIVSVPFGCEKLIEVDGDVQADLDSTHHYTFDRPDDVDKLFIYNDWDKYYSLIQGVTYIAVYYNKNEV